MKKIIILLILFTLLLFFAIFLAVNETQKRSDRGKIPSPMVTPTGKSVPAQVSLFLTISSPSSNQTVSDTSIIIKGTTTPLTQVMINEFELTSDSQGNFSKSLSLDEGENYINVIAYNGEGQVVEEELIITREVQE